MKTALSIALMIAMVGCSKPDRPPAVLGADGHTYRLVQPSKRLPDGTESAAQYERDGDPGKRFGRLLGPGDPMFWEMR